ncbi:MAG TPA: hypothetical protein VEL05_05605, partial [Candidatus Acidoferrum sp.]|nr:hypothetical protein [Candidatus Acidoferrum sp.]
PSAWGTGPDDVPPSITAGDAAPQPLGDAATALGSVATASDGTDVSALFDDTSATTATFTVANPFVTVQLLAGARQVAFYTLTSGIAEGAAPTSWIVRGSSDGINWTLIDKRAGEKFRWRNQTRAFKVAIPGAYAFYRIELMAPPSTTLAEMELLARP